MPPRVRALVSQLLQVLKRQGFPALSSDALRYPHPQQPSHAATATATATHIEHDYMTHIRHGSTPGSDEMLAHIAAMAHSPTNISAPTSPHARIDHLTEWRLHDRHACNATRHLLTKIIPAMATHLNTGNVVLRSPVTQQLHEAGINAR